MSDRHELVTFVLAVADVNFSWSSATKKLWQLAVSILRLAPPSGQTARRNANPWDTVEPDRRARATASARSSPATGNGRFAPGLIRNDRRRRARSAANLVEAYDPGPQPCRWWKQRRLLQMLHANGRVGCRG